ncbi:MAG: transporter substrate-binding domain-containing protein [Deltaproteobacteria bacterium]|nr:transporter substrate-binding domain-containing protein [Deltaproteobacteria bacterium]
MTKKMIILILSAVLFFSAFRPDAMARDLIATVGIIPPHSMKGEDGQPQGGFVEIVQAIDAVFTEGKISIRLYPVARASNTVKTGKADFCLPAIPHPYIPLDNQPVSFASEPITKVSFVLYTRADQPPLPLELLGQYRIDVIRGTDIFPFHVWGVNDTEQGILKVLAGRSDGFISEQDAADDYIRKNQLKNIRRALYHKLNSSVLIPKGPKGKEIDRIISSALRKLKASGELQKITDKIHRPYSDWQPYKRNW